MTNHKNKSKINFSEKILNF